MTKNSVVIISALLLIVTIWSSVSAYKTVVVVHGLNCGADSFEDTKQKILEAHPGTNVILLKYFENLKTLDPMPEQVDLVVSELEKIREENPGGIHLLCHSQGSLVCLDAVLSLKNHTIDTFISLSGPLFGQYGIPGDFWDNVPILRPLLNLTRDLISPILYDDTFQLSASFANYWRDPRPSLQEKYERFCYFLPYCLGDPHAYFYSKEDAARRKENFLGLKKLVLVGGPGDEIIKPWQSALFGYYGNDTYSETMVEMTDTKMYIDDWFGLRTMNERGGLTQVTIGGIRHDDWAGSDLVLKTAVYPWLT